MLENWLHPIRESLTQQVSENQVKAGGQLRRYIAGLPNLKDVRVAIIGIGEAEADAVRQHLYRLSWPFGHIPVADLGNVRREEPSFVAPLLIELLDSNICPIVIGREEHFMAGQFTAHHGWQKSVSLTVVDEKLAFLPGSEKSSEYYLSEILDNKERLFHFSAIGLQSHFLDDDIASYLQFRHFDRLHLGALREDLMLAEPLVRDADLVSFHLAALKRIEAPGVPNATAAGLFSEEACQLSRYAGMSDKLSSIGFYGYHLANDPAGDTAQLVAQLIWYFMDGFSSKKNDFPKSMDGLLEYIIPMQDLDYQLTFWKSSKSGRWWLQVPVSIGNNQNRHRLIPCSYQDYLDASTGKLPDRFLNAFRRFDG